MGLRGSDDLQARQLSQTGASREYIVKVDLDTNALVTLAKQKLTGDGSMANRSLV